MTMEWEDDCKNIVVSNVPSIKIVICHLVRDTNDTLQATGYKYVHKYKTSSECYLAQSHTHTHTHTHQMDTFTHTY